MKSLEYVTETKAHNLVEMENGALEKALKKDLGLNLTIKEKIIGGYQSQVYEATFEGRAVFIRINNDPQVFKTEIMGYEIFKQNGIPTPDIITYKERPPTIGHPIMIISAAQGLSVSEVDLSPEQESTIYEEAGEILKTINKVTLDGFGPLEISDGKFRGRFQSYQEYCESWESSVYQAIDFLKIHNLITSEDEQKLYRLFEEIRSLDIEKSSLLHRDMHKGHIFIDHDKITGIIDLGRLFAGDPRYDVAYSFVYQNPVQQQHFKRGYGKLADDPMVLAYLIIITAEKILFRSKANNKESAIVQTKLLKEMLSKVA
jgi:aminoglycoside phosphotransferase (APT) family kinase protein